MIELLTNNGADPEDVLSTPLLLSHGASVLRRLGVTVHQVFQQTSKQNKEKKRKERERKEKRRRLFEIRKTLRERKKKK